MEVFADPVVECREDASDGTADDRCRLTLLTGRTPATGEGRVLSERGTLQRAAGGRGRSLGHGVAHDSWDAGSSRTFVDRWREREREREREMKGDVGTGQHC